MATSSRVAPAYVLRRVALAVAIALAHLGLVVMLAYTTTTTTTTSPPAIIPIVVSVLPAPSRTPENLALPRPALVEIKPLLQPPPEFQLPDDHSSILASTVSSVGAHDHEPGPAPGPAPLSPALQTMSTVAYLQRPVPHYPRESRLAHEEGLVLLRVVIDEGGHVRDIEIYQSSGHPRLDNEAREAVMRAVFRPYVESGVARAAIAMVPIEFSLRGKS